MKKQRLHQKLWLKFRFFKLLLETSSHQFFKISEIFLAKKLATSWTICIMNKPKNEWIFERFGMLLGIQSLLHCGEKANLIINKTHTVSTDFRNKQSHIYIYFFFSMLACAICKHKFYNMADCFKQWKI